MYTPRLAHMRPYACARENAIAVSSILTSEETVSPEKIDNFSGKIRNWNPNDFLWLKYYMQKKTNKVYCI